MNCQMKSAHERKEPKCKNVGENEQEVFSSEISPARVWHHFISPPWFLGMEAARIEFETSASCYYIGMRLRILCCLYIVCCLSKTLFFISLELALLELEIYANGSGKASCQSLIIETTQKKLYYSVQCSRKY
jgi:hypothetical protein